MVQPKAKQRFSGHKNGQGQPGEELLASTLSLEHGYLFFQFFSFTIMAPLKAVCQTYYSVSSFS